MALFMLHSVKLADLLPHSTMHHLRRCQQATRRSKAFNLNMVSDKFGFFSFPATFWMMTLQIKCSVEFRYFNVELLNNGLLKLECLLNMDLPIKCYNANV